MQLSLINTKGYLNKNKFAFGISTFIALLIILFSLNYDITDRISYVNSIIDFPLFITSRFINNEWYFALFNDPLWVLTIGVFYFLNLQPEYCIVLLSLLSFLTANLVIFRNNKKYFLMLPIILSAGFLVNYISHIRQGLALSIFLIVFYSTNRNKRIIKYILPALIHNSFFFISSIFFFEKHSYSRIHKKYNHRIVKILIIPLLIILTRILGRQVYFANSVQFDWSILGFGFLYWLTLYAIIILNTLPKGKIKILLNAEFTFILIYLGIYFIEPTVAGRLMEIMVVIIFLKLVKFTNPVTFQILSWGYFTLSWISRYDSSYLGFGV